MRVTESQLARLEEQPVNLSLASSQRDRVAQALEQLRGVDEDAALKAQRALSYIWSTLEHLNKSAMQTATRPRPEQPGAQPRA